MLRGIKKSKQKDKNNLLLRVSEEIYLFEAYCLKVFSEQKAKRDKRLELLKTDDKKQE